MKSEQEVRKEMEKMIGLEQAAGMAGEESFYREYSTQRKTLEWVLSKPSTRGKK